MEVILKPWPWYISGPLISLVMVLLLYFGKTFGMSGNLRTLCSIGGAGKFAEFFRFDWRAQRWNLVVVLGTVIGGFLAVTYLSDGSVIDLNSKTVSDLAALNLDNAGSSLLPPEIYSWEYVLSAKGLAILIGGGFMVGCLVGDTSPGSF